MTPQDVARALDGLPFMTLEQGERLTEFLEENGLYDCLELGFFHGVSTAYIAASLERRGRGHLVTIDLESARSLQPNLDEVMARLRLSHRVTAYYEPRSYTWRLMRMLEESEEPRFDFCYIDGGHTWDASGFAFCLVSRLLRPGGWVLFDDLNWTMEANLDPSKWGGATAEERSTAQIRKVYDLLVRRDPAFTTFRVEGDWAFAQKRVDAPSATSVRTEVELLGPREIARRVRGRLRRTRSRLRTLLPL